MSKTEDTNTTQDHKRQMDRRRFLRTVGVTAGSAAVASTGADRLGLSPVEQSEAVIPAIWGVAAVAGLTWTLADVGIIGSDAPPDTLGPQALKDQIYQTMATRKSTNQSTLLDNENILSYIKEPAFGDAKTAAVEAINNDKTKAEVVAEGEAAVNAHIATVEQNLLSSWNESVSEYQTMFQSVQSSSLAVKDVWSYGTSTSINASFPSVAETLSDGTDFQVKRLSFNSTTWSPIAIHEGDNSSGVNAYINGDGTVYLGNHVWQPVWTGIQNAKQDTLNSLSVWVDNAYSAIEAGELDPDELLTPTDLSDSYAGDNVRAIADLQALGIPNAGGNESVVQLSDEYNTKMSGLLAHTGPTGDLSEGDVVDPNATDENGNPVYNNWYISHNVAEWQAVVTQYYDTGYGIQGGTIRTTRDPSQMYGRTVDGLTHSIETTDGETVTVEISQFTQGTDSNGNTVWTVDIVDQLNTTTTGINGVKAYQTSNEPRFKTEPITTQFEILETSDGALQFERPREPQTDSNYLTQEEWQAFRENTQENINAYKDSQSVDIPGIGGVTDAFGSLRDLAIAGGLVILALFGLSAVSN